jgi:hypothetical protein
MKPGIHLDVPEDAYHGGPELSSSGAKTLLRNPARYHYERTHPRPSTDAMDVGSIAHHLILHRGGSLLVVDAYDWKTKAAQAARDEGRAQGVVVIHRGQLLQASRMARAVRNHPLASAIFTDGQPEVSIYWDEEVQHDDGSTSLVPCRARIDWLRDNAIVDLKTTAREATPDGFAKVSADFGYHISAAHYSLAVERATGKRLPFVLVAVEKDEPHYVTVHQFDDSFLAIGEERMADAYALWARCDATGEWPTPIADDQINTLYPPRWL